MIKLLAAFAFLLLDFYTYNYLAREPVIPHRRAFSEFPLQLGDWTCDQRGSISEEVWKNLGATDILICGFHRGGEYVDLYVGYHASQVREQGGGAGENSIHPPAHCLPGSGWDIIDNRTVPLDFEALRGRQPTAKRLIVARDRDRQLVYYWYQSRGRVISQDWQKIVFVGWDRALLGRTDGSLVRFTIPIIRGDEERAERTFRDFAPRVLALLDTYVPQ